MLAAMGTVGPDLVGQFHITTSFLTPERKVITYVAGFQEEAVNTSQWSPQYLVDHMLDLKTLTRENYFMGKEGRSTGAALTQSLFISLILVRILVPGCFKIE